MASETISSKTTVPKTTAKTTSEELTSTIPTEPMAIDEEAICHYLCDHPDFFIRHASEVENIAIPHPVRDVVSLPEWQMARQRHKIQQLEAEITQLMENASMNEQLVNQFIVLQNQLMVAVDLNQLSDLLNSWAKSMGLTGAYLYLFDDKWQLGAPLNYYRFMLNALRFDFIRIRHLQYSHHYLGSLNSAELDLLLPEHDLLQRAHIGSVALSLLGEFGDLGVLMFTSANPHHYQAGQGTWLIEKISSTLPILINQWISRKK